MNSRNTSPILSASGRATRAIAVAGLLLALGACEDELYRNLSEQDANQMIVALEQAGVGASKTTSDEGHTWTLMVGHDDMAAAMQTLTDRGLPEKRFDNLGELFKRDGLVSTPTEERVRFVYGLSQELSQTLSRIDGVLVARVQIVLPNNDPLADQVRPSSASVFIKYQRGFDVGTLNAQIKTLITHSVEGLTYDQVSVTAVAADPTPAVKRASAHSLMPIAIGAGALFMLSAVSLFVWLQRGKPAQRSRNAFEAVANRIRRLTPGRSNA
ncbi:MAG: type III secretion system inner membrane ring lipoprotein SctJ [Burkholderiaceae bacterium]